MGYENPQDYFLKNQFASVFRSQIDGQDALIFKNINGELVALAHSQDCCETVTLEEIIGDLNDLVNTPILLAEERTNSHSVDFGRETWTFYTFRTIKGTVDLRFIGSSNGYYSERVDFWWNAGLDEVWTRWPENCPIKDMDWPEIKLSPIEVIDEKIRRLELEKAALFSPTPTDSEGE